MPFVSNLPKNTPYPFVTAEPDPITVVRYLRASDYLAFGAIAAGFPSAFFLLGRAALLQVPMYATLGFAAIYINSLMRFWGWKENAIEAKQFAHDSANGTLRPAWWNWQ
ncbi:hypothetical protein M427DRAFT_28771 [Gonapodya prolifera JEL478]|uniref:NADH-ubiquinone oxidoreductase 21kDa subunit N-terminal domain-containing protein n=1 Tax=Gonapodya prolifera (strain JEL478) TaxID=1344416 RepID=A0A139AT38_GONPJ|nr:hypothetical protein M427DRAFT_28771 [Gonapodya prolifera JEL478]|eukprot:KXS19900.1 hypothetical protein M427DRAFT_28771 [Gonapodya prolifera JEL478]